MKRQSRLIIWKLKPGNEQIKNYTLHKTNLHLILWRSMLALLVPTYWILHCLWLEPRQKASSSWISSILFWIKEKTNTTIERYFAYWIKPLLIGEIKLDRELIWCSISHPYSCLLRPAGSTVLKQLSPSWRRGCRITSCSSIGSSDIRVSSLMKLR